MKISGIYQIQSKMKSYKIYIGSAVDISKRWRDHLNLLRKDIHPNSKLQRHYNKYHESDLQFSVLLGCERKELISKEQFFIDSYNPWFNNRRLANSNLGLKMSEETKRKMSIAMFKRFAKHPHSEETREKMRRGVANRPPISNETREKMSEAKKVPVVQLNMDGDFIRDWDSPVDVQRSISIDKGNILNNLSGKRPSAGGYKWKYKKEYYDVA
ncbi:MAG: GIY-YIG nuclease family protein [Candidatus Cloacimonetes bacterium]|nr:GIY-YIG nuclease family protein [Candidatus Cloacimonadota bacterium]